MHTPRTRWITLDFLDFCDPRIHDFYQYWNGKRGGRPMPSRADLDPAEIKSFLPSIMLVDVVSRSPLQLRYRLVGTREAQARGGDPTGKLIGEAFFGRSEGQVLENYLDVTSRGVPVFDNDEVKLEDPMLRDAGTILLPLSDDGKWIDRVIAYAALGDAVKSAVLPRANELYRYPGLGQFGAPRPEEDSE